MCAQARCVCAPRRANGAHASAQSAFVRCAVNSGGACWQGKRQQRRPRCRHVLCGEVRVLRRHAAFAFRCLLLLFSLFPWRRACVKNRIVRPTITNESSASESPSRMNHVMCSGWGTTTTPTGRRHESTEQHHQRPPTNTINGTWQLNGV